MTANAAERAPRPRGSLTVGGLIMFVLGALLSWVPVLGPLVAGGAGGWYIGRGRAALGVALAPALLLGAATVLVLSVVELPVLGVVAGATLFLIVAVQQIPLLLGAYAAGQLRE